MARRSTNADGSIYAYSNTRGKKRWRVQLWLQNESGKPQRVSKAGFQTHKEAKEYLNQLRTNTGPALNREGQTSPLFEEYSKKWLLSLVDLEASTTRAYERNLRLHLTPFLGRMKIDEITHSELQEVVHQLSDKEREGENGLTRELGQNTVKKVMSLAYLIFKDAAAQGLIVGNPMQTVRVPRQVQPDKSDQVWKSTQLQEFLDWNKQEGDDLHCLWQLVAYTGVRRGEALALTWSNVDLDKQRIHIRSSADSAITRRVKSTKTKSSNRVVDIDEDLASTLAEHRIQRAELGKEFVEPSSFVFGTLENELRVPNDVSARWGRQMKKWTKLNSGSVRPITIHGLRHSHATHLLERGIHAKTVQGRLGHTSFRITMDLYGHVTREMEKGVLEAINELKSYSKHKKQHN